MDLYGFKKKQAKKRQKMKKAAKIRSIYQKFYFCLKSLISVTCVIGFSKLY